MNAVATTARATKIKHKKKTSPIAPASDPRMAPSTCVPTAIPDSPEAANVFIRLSDASGLSRAFGLSVI